MFQSIIGLVIFVAVALVGWGIAELKAKGCNYEQNDEERDVDAHLAQQLHEKGFSEMGISDVIRNISTKGFKTK